VLDTNHDFGNTQATGLESRKEFDMKYVAGYHLMIAGVIPVFLLVKIGLRTYVFQPRISHLNPTLIFNPEKFDSPNGSI
jgi:hypothetical protein